MIHYTCDMCGKKLKSEDEVRYKVEITVEMKSCSHEEDYDPFDEEEMIRYMLEDDDEFNLHGLSEKENREEEEEHYKRMVYDLCRSCRKVYVKDPLFKNVRHRFGFTEN